MRKRKLVWALLLAYAMGALLSTVAAAAAEGEKSTRDVPPELVGEWFEGSVSPTNYYDSQTGRHVGNARSMGSILKIYADGTYEKYVYIYMRTYNLESEVWTTTKGLLSFKKNKIALTPTSGHYKSTVAGKKTDRDMTDEELKQNATAYKYRLETDKETGRTYLVMPFEDGSAFRYRRWDEEKKESQ